MTRKECRVGLLVTRHLSLVTVVYRLACPAGAFFLTFGFWEPRGSVRLALGGRFLRGARFSFLRSCLSLIFVVSISAGFILLVVESKGSPCGCPTVVV